MAFEDLRERVGSQLKSYWERFQETTVYNQAKDRFENLSPVMQKFILIFAGVLTAAMILSFPYGFYSTSTELMDDFQVNRDLTRELLKTARDASQIPPITPAPSASELESRIQQRLQGAQLLPEQIKSVSTIGAKSNLLNEKLIAYGTEVMLAKLNLTQVVNIGYQLAHLDRLTVKVKDVELTPNPQDARYIDATFRLIAFQVPEFKPSFPPEPPAKGRKNARTRKAPVDSGDE